MNGWANWAGNVRAPAAEIVRPHDLDELRGALHRAQRQRATVRVVGGGHSFTPLVHSDGFVLDLGALCGIGGVDAAARQVWVGAGTPIYALGHALWQQGLSLPNQGDVDVQTIAGAVGTGTHGTGPELRCLSAAVAAVELMLADGTLVRAEPAAEPELFQAARLSIGAVGVVTALCLQLLDAYFLHERTWLMATLECLDRLAELSTATRHFEFFWLPDSDRCFAKSLHPAPPPVEGVESPLGRNERVDRAYRVFPSVRSERFVEMEFAVPAAAGPACFEELRQLYLNRHPDVTWPIEYRTLAADDTWIGPASGRDSVTLSVHQAAELDHRRLFTDAEAIFRNHRGRPHWGKLHSFTGEDLAGEYRQWERFWTVADRVDPERRFRNDHLAGWRG